MGGQGCRIPRKRLIQRRGQNRSYDWNQSHGGVMKVMRYGQFIVVK